MEALYCILGASKNMETIKCIIRLRDFKLKINVPVTLHKPTEIYSKDFK